MCWTFTTKDNSWWICFPFRCSSSGWYVLFHWIHWTVFPLQWKEIIIMPCNSCLIAVYIICRLYLLYFLLYKFSFTTLWTFVFISGILKKHTSSFWLPVFHFSQAVDHVATLLNWTFTSICITSICIICTTLFPFPVSIKQFAKSLRAYPTKALQLFYNSFILCSSALFGDLMQLCIYWWLLMHPLKNVK